MTALRDCWHPARLRASLHPNSGSGSSATHKLLSNKHQLQPVANTEMRAVLRTNFCWAYLSWSYFPWYFHLMDYSECCWSVRVDRVIAGWLWGSSKSIAVNAHREILCSWRILQKHVKNAKHFGTSQCDSCGRWWPLSRQGQCSRYPSLIHQAASPQGFFSVKEMLSTGSKAKCHLQEGSVPTYGAD